MKEFTIISRYFSHMPRRKEVILGIGDDCALVKPPANQLLAISTDTLVVGTHFFPEMPAKDVGYKALAVNLSDLAAMGAEPAFALLSLTLPDLNEHWLEQFAIGFFELAKKFKLDLIGGNMARGPLAITAQVQGYVPENKILRRDAVKNGDLIFVSGALGAAAGALRVVQQNLQINAEIREQLLQAWYRPQPRIALGLALREYAHAAIDISDGLLADLNHLLEASRLGATLEVAKIPVAASVGQVFDPDLSLQLALNGGEDYELCFTAPAKFKDLLESQYQCIAIGQIEKEQGLRLQKTNGSILPLIATGFQHF